MQAREGEPPLWPLVLIAVVVGVFVGLALSIATAGGQETCNVEGTCLIPPAVIHNPEYVG